VADPWRGLTRGRSWSCATREFVEPPVRSARRRAGPGPPRAPQEAGGGDVYATWHCPGDDDEALLSFLGSRPGAPRGVGHRWWDRGQLPDVVYQWGDWCSRSLAMGAAILALNFIGDGSAMCWIPDAVSPDRGSDTALWTRRGGGSRGIAEWGRARPIAYGGLRSGRSCATSFGVQSRALTACSTADAQRRIRIASRKPPADSERCGQIGERRRPSWRNDSPASDAIA